MEHCRSNGCHSPENALDCRHRDDPESTGTSEVVYRSVVYDSGIGLSSFQSVDTNSLQRDVTGPESLLENFKRLNFNEQKVESFPIQNLTNDCPIQTLAGCDWFSEEEIFRQDQEGDTCLHLAIIKPDTRTVFHMIEMAESPEYLDIQNLIYMHAPLHLAVIMDQPHVVRALVVSGASVMTRDRHGNTALHLACKLGHLECVRQLTAPPSEDEQKYVSCLCAARNLPRRVIKPMLSSDIGLMNYEGETCLHLALSSGAASKTAIMDYLISVCGANINVEEGKCGYTILHQAVKTKDVEMVTFVLRYEQISVNQLCYSGNTVLDIAVSLSLPQLETILCASGGICTEQPEDDDEVDEFDDLTIGGQQMTS